MQNELRELWSLLNLLLPQLFDNKAQFARWFGDALARTGGPGAGGEQELIDNEKRVVVVNRCVSCGHFAQARAESIHLLQSTLFALQCTYF